jgi:A/G-specific adenine glycosylase
MENMHKQDIHQFQQKILSRYQIHKRDLPRRDTFDPYKVLVSETMLQQTQVDRVIPKFLAWMETLPTLRDLAAVEKHTLLSLWSGLGFNSRAIRLQQAAKIIVDSSNVLSNPPPQAVPLPYQGGHLDGFPTNREEWMALPGIGPYTSAAILAFAFNQEVPVVDTNIRRVLMREL